MPAEPQTFSSTFFPTFWGAFLGFLFALALFYITERLKQALHRKELKAFLVKEFTYNLHLMEEWQEDVERLLRDISGENRGTTVYIQYSQFLTHFLQRAYQEGLAFNFVKDENIGEWVKFLSNFTAGIESFLNRLIGEWKNGVATKDDMLVQFNYQHGEIKKARKRLSEVIKKL